MLLKLHAPLVLSLFVLTEGVLKKTDGWSQGGFDSTEKLSFEQCVLLVTCVFVTIEGLGVFFYWSCI